MPTINDFVANLKKYGIAKTNRFNLILTLPEAVRATLNADQPNNTDLPKEVIEGVFPAEAERSMTLMCQSVSIPGYNVSTLEMNTGTYIRKIPYDRSTGEFDMVFYASGDMIEKKAIDAWMHSIFTANHRLAFYDSYVTDITVQQLNDADEVVYEALLTECYPGLVNPLSMDRSALNTPMLFQVGWNYRKLEENITKKAAGLGAAQLVYPEPPNDDEYPTLSLPDAPPQQSNWTLFIVDIYKNIERVKREIENGMDPAAGARLIRNLLNDVRGATGLGSDIVDGIVGYANDILFVLNRK